MNGPEQVPKPVLKQVLKRAFQETIEKGGGWKRKESWPESGLKGQEVEY